MPEDARELAREQEFLADAHASLRRMRERVEQLEQSSAGNLVSQQVLGATLAVRLKQLADDPSVPLFFGRIDRDVDRDPDGGTDRAEQELHIGRRHISDEDGDPLVLDWRAPVSTAFYRATASDPMGVRRRRRYGFNDGRLTSFEDEDLGVGSGPELSSLVEAEVERPRVGPMRDIVATIQPEQDVLVRAELAQTVCVQGAPGTGKTAVGLHRAAYLLYAYREQLVRRGVVVVGPNASFLRYIRAVLPALGEVDAKQVTFEELLGTRIRAVEEPAVATLKGDARLAEVLRRALWSQLSAPTQTLVVPSGSRRWTVLTSEAVATVEALRDGRYGAGQVGLARALAHHILVKMERAGEAPDDRVQDAVARTKPVKDYVAALWPKADPARLLWRLLSEPEFLASSADGILTDEEQALLRWPKPARTPGTARWTLADAVLLDELADLIERTPSVAHIVVDEAQDLSPMMLRALGRRATTGSFTVLGDLAQATTPWAVGSWEAALEHLGKPDGHVEQLTRGFRVPAEVIEYAARLLPHIAPQLDKPVAARTSRGELRLTSDPLRQVVEQALGREGSVALIVPDASLHEVTKLLKDFVFTVVGGEGESAEAEFDAHFDVVPASLAKGLEFDHVVLVDPAGIVAGEPDRTTGLRRLYVCLTRAVSTLSVHHADDLPDELRSSER